MHKFQNEPILLIKDAWGGKSLMVDFRSPSGGPIPDEKSKDKAGVYYKLLIEHVKEVLADPKKVYPNYNPKEGYELAGFVWFQGFNDLVGSYPAVDVSKGKKGIKDYSEYSRLLSCFIRDVRKDLSLPKLPFVIGVLGVGGETAGENTDAFRKAMAAPGETQEFKGSVANVFTQKFWPAEIDAVLAKSNSIKSEFATKEKELKAKQLKGEDRAKAEAKLAEEKQAKLDKALTKDELFLLENGISNQAYLMVQLTIKRQKNLGRIVICRSHETSGARGLIHCLRVPTPFRVIPVIATNRVRCGSTSGCGSAWPAGSNPSNWSQNGFSGSTSCPQIAMCRTTDTQRSRSARLAILSGRFPSAASIAAPILSRCCE